MDGWKTDLEQLLEKVDAAPQRALAAPVQRPQVTQFFTVTVLPALREVQEVLVRHGRSATVSSYLDDVEQASATIVVWKGSERAIEYTVRVDIHHDTVIPFAETRARSWTGQTYAGKSPIRPGVQHYQLQDLTKDDIARNVVDHCLPMLRQQLDTPPP
jgi:hypothetical protein